MGNRWFAALRSAFYATVFLTVWGWLALQLRPLDPRFGLELPAGARTIGLVLMAVGGSLALACVATFVTHGRGTPAPFDPPRAFVAAGPYRWVRNPMYTGGAVLLAGFGCWHRSGAMVLFVVVFLAVFHAFVTLYEEPRLKERFGEPYEEYLRTVNRWIPRAPAGPPSPVRE